MRPALQDSVYVDVGWRGEPRLALVRSGTLEPVQSGGEAAVEDVAVELEDFSTQAVMLERAHAESEGPSIEDADVIVAGGRGLGEPDKFALLEELAAALGGAVAATRAVVDAGWYPYATQVGQTGKTVAPKLYVACGISGAIQHKVGMQASGTIVAINKDPNAPIFEYADVGVVGDLHEIVPKLTELVKERADERPARRLPAARSTGASSSPSRPTRPTSESTSACSSSARARRARRGDPGWAAARGAAGAARAARRRPGRGRREGQGAGRAPALRRRRQSARASASSSPACSPRTCRSGRRSCARASTS